MAPTPSEQDSKFAHLLIPIKDLTKNWDVDIAKYLEEYLSELDHIDISFSGGQLSLNFAEVALLIQGSACVYSRKVDLLWQLVMGMLDTLRSGKKIIEETDSCNEKSDSLNVKSSVYEDEFKSLISSIKIGKQIDLKKDFTKTTQSVQLLVAAPLSLIENQNYFSKKKLPINFCSTDVLGHKQDFRVNSPMCSLHSFVKLTSHNCCGAIHSTSVDEVPRAESPIEIPDDMACPSPDNIFSSSFLQGSQEEFSNFMDSLANVDMNTMNLEKGPKLADEGIKEGSAEFFIDPMKPISPSEPCNGLRPIRKCRSSKIPLGLILRIRSEAEVKEVNKMDKAKISKKAKFMPLNPSLPIMVNLKADDFHIPYKEIEGRMDSCSEDSGYEGSKDRCFSSIICEVDKDSDINTSADTGIAIDGIDLDLPYPEPLFPNIDASDSVKNKSSARDEQVVSLPISSSPICSNYFDDYQLFDHNSTSPEDTDLQNYQQLVQQKVQEYLSSAQEYIVSSELDKRVHQWQELIRPRLAVAEKRPEFNVCDYSTKILDSFSNSHDTSLHLEELCNGADEAEVSRIFLASLVLANTYNVGISSDGVNAMTLELLSTERHQDQLKEFIAPSHTPSQHNGEVTLETPSKKPKIQKLKTYKNRKKS